MNNFSIQFQANNLMVIIMNGKIYLGVKSKSTLSCLKTTIRNNSGKGYIIPDNLEFGLTLMVDSLGKQIRPKVLSKLTSSGFLKQLNLDVSQISTFVNQMKNLVNLIEGKPAEKYELAEVV